MLSRFMQIALVVLLAAAGGCMRGVTPTGPAAVPEGPCQLRIVFTAGLRGSPEASGCGCRRSGGLAARAQLFGQLRAQGPPLLICDLGPLFDPDQSLPIDAARALLQGLALTRPDAVTIAPTDMARHTDRLCRETAALELPLVSASLEPCAPAAALIPATLVRRCGRLLVGITGLALDDTRTCVRDPIAAARLAVAGLRAQGCNLVVVLSQLPPPRIRQLVDAVPDIDVILCTDPAGFSHRLQNQTLICALDPQSGAAAGMIEISLPHPGSRLGDPQQLTATRALLDRVAQDLEQTRDASASSRLEASRVQLSAELRRLSDRGSARCRHLPLTSPADTPLPLRDTIERFRRALTVARLADQQQLFLTTIPGIDLTGLDACQRSTCLRLLHELPCGQATSIVSGMPADPGCRQLADAIIAAVRRGDSEGRIRFSIIRRDQDRLQQRKKHP